MIIPIKFGGAVTPGISPEIVTPGGNVDWITGLDAYIETGLSPSFSDDTKFGLADIYSVDAETGVRTFLYTHNVDNLGSDAINPRVGTVEGVYVFKSTVGKPIKIYVMEGTFEPDARNIGSVPAGPRQDLIDFVLSDNNIVYGRSDAFPLAFSTFTSKVSDVLRRRQGFSDV
jgi:hypothetical protein